MIQKTHRQVINIAIASPGDVQKERDAVLRVFTQWNDKKADVILHPVMWEHSAVPEMGDHPQHILDSKIILKSDLLIGILRSRLGTPTPTADSGTVEEIREFIKKKGPKRVMLYFCTRDIPSKTDATELKRLQDFKEQMRLQGLCHNYWAVEEFEKDLYRHLDSKIEELVSGDLPEPVAAIEKSKSIRLHPDKRMNTPIEFGRTLPTIATGFLKRMDEFNALSGQGPDKFYALGAHVYSSAALCLDGVIAFSASGISLANRRALESISSRLKHLAAEIPDGKADFRQYWIDGTQIAKDLSAHVKHIERTDGLQIGLAPQL